MNALAESPFDACLKDALAQSAEWVPRWLGHLLGTLLQREAAAEHLHEKQAFSRARIALVGHRERVAERFLAALAESLQGSLPQDAAPAARPATTARSLSSLSCDDLELMDHRQVQETVDLARVQQVVKMAADEELVAFSARLSRAQGLDVVRHQTNPLRPDVVVGALMRALSGLQLDEAVRARWLHAGAVSLGHELQQLYRRLTDQLDRRGVQPAGYAVIQTAAPRGAAGASAARTGSAPVAAVMGRDAQLTLDHLHQLLLDNLNQNGHTVFDQGASGSGNPMGRTLAAEVVTLMLRRIAEDTRLLQPVRDRVQALKPALLQLAGTDPRFFADRQNPARRLLDTLTARGLGFTSEQDAGFGVYTQQLQDIVQALQAPTPNLPDLLPELLQRLNRGDAAAQTPPRGLAMQTGVRVEQRHLLAERVAVEMQARNDFARAPGVVRRFLSGPWAQVVAQARMDAAGSETTVPGDAPALRYMDVLPDLLWSSQLAQASHNRPRLIKLIPGLLRTLREGLDAIDYPRAQTEAFFQALMGLHEAAYKALHTGTWMHPTEALPEFRDTELLQSDWQQLRAEPAQPHSGHL